MTTPDRYRRLFGEVAIEKGWVGEAQIYEALTVQERLRNDGKQVPLLGQVLVELGAFVSGTGSAADRGPLSGGKRWGIER